MMNTKSKENYWKHSLIACILFLGIILFREFLPFLSGLLAAGTIYILVRKQMEWLVGQKKIRKSIAASIILLQICLCFVIPAFFGIWVFVEKVSSINLNPTALIAQMQGVVDLVESKTEYDLLSTQNMASAVSFITKMGQALVGEISSFSINAMVLVFFLYFMLISKDEMEQYFYSILPFNDENKKKVLSEVKVMVTSNALGIPLLTVIQGSIALLAYWYFDVPNPVLFGILTAVGSIVPIVGTAIVWAPLAIYLGLTGDWAGAIGLTAYALIIISNVDNLARFLLQKKMADTHPLITIFGAFIGLSLFGFWGVIFGPLMLSIFILCINMFKKEYLD